MPLGVGRWELFGSPLTSFSSAHPTERSGRTSLQLTLSQPFMRSCAYHPLSSDRDVTLALRWISSWR